MQNADISTNVLIAILIVFICLASAGLIVYTVFFAIHKSYLRRHINLAKKWNELLNGLNGINIFKIQILDSHDIGNKLELKKYISMHQKLKSNLLLIKKNIDVSLKELNAFNLKVTKKYQYSINQDLDKALANLAELKEAYDRYTQYGTSIQIVAQNYREIYEALSLFFVLKVQYHEDFNEINTLFSSIKKTFESIPNLSNEFDYKKTVNTVVDLSAKLKTLSDIVILVYRFQIVDTYLKSSRECNDKIIANHYEEIDKKDLQSLQNLLTVYNHAYKNFSNHYRKLELGKARGFAIQAINAMFQVNQFTMVHTSTPTMIATSINEIKEQSDRILTNKNDIITSIKDLKQYFVLEPKITQHFDLIEKDINYISVLNNAAEQVNYSTHSEKVQAIRELSNIGNQIVRNKQEIVESIDLINDMLAKVIKTVTDLNDMYIYFWQLLSFIKQIAPSGDDSQQMQKVIKSSLKQIEEYSKQIIANDNPDFDAIAYELSSIVEQSNQIYQRLTASYVLKTYANKLFIYANRYKKYKDLKPEFESANKLFKAKKYDDCIDQLLKIIKFSKKHKNKEA